MSEPQLKNQLRPKSGERVFFAPVLERKLCIGHVDLGLKCGHWAKVGHRLLSLFLCVSFTLGPWSGRWSVAAPELQGEGASLSQQYRGAGTLCPLHC